MTALAKATITAIVISSTAFPQQAATPQKSQAKQPSATKVGRYYMHRPPSGNFFEMTWMFQDTSCHSYSLKLGPQFKEINTEGFWVVKGRVVGSTLVVEASAKTDDAATERARTMLSKCPTPE